MYLQQTEESLKVLAINVTRLLNFKEKRTWQLSKLCTHIHVLNKLPVHTWYVIVNNFKNYKTKSEKMTYEQLVENRSSIKY